MPNLPPPPDRDPLITDEQRKVKYYMAPVWLDWIIQFVALLGQTARSVVLKRYTAQGASIGTTALLAVGTLSATRFRIAIAARVSQQATTSSSLVVRINTTIDGIACTMSTPALVSNDRTKPESVTWLVRADSPLLLTFDTTYASVGATPMQYELTVAVEAMP